MPLARAEAGCIDYALHAQKDDPSTVVIYESWKDEAALAFRRGTPYMQEFMTKAAPELTAGPPTMVASRDMT